jgi:hypothetical protein
MPLPAGYALDAPASNLPPGYTLDAPQHDFSTLTANPKGEGTYQINAPGGQKIAVPYSNVPVFIGGLQGSSFSSPEEQQRFDKDAASDPHRPTFWNALTNPIGSGAAKQGVVTGAQQVGGQAIKTIAQPIIHPIDTAGSLLKSGAYIAGTGAGVKMPESWNPVASVVQSYQNDKAQGGTALALENLGGQAIGTVEGGRMIAPVVKASIPVVADAASSAGTAASDAASAVKSKLYPQSQSLAADTSAARNLSRALVVSPQAAPNFIRAATDEAGTITDFAQKNNLPINSKVDFANAAKATADTVQQHFQENILGPNADTVTRVPPNYRGVTSGGGMKIGETPTTTPPTATLGDINDRINAINQELNPNFRKGLASQTSAANVSDAELIAEKGKLTSILHNRLADATGLEPSDIADVRQQAGKLRTIADEAQLSANQDTAAAGKQAMGATTSAVGTKVGLIDRAMQKVQGGPEVIGNRQIISALKKVTPNPMQLPQPKISGATQ